VGKKFTGTAVYLLSGLIYCGQCGATLGGTSRTRRVKSGEMVKYHYYTCAKKGREGCTLPDPRKEWVEGVVIAAVTERLFSEEGTAALLQHLQRWRNETLASRDTALADANKQLAGVERELTNLLNAIAKGVPATGMMAEKIDALERERATIILQLRAVTALDAEPDDAALRAILRRVA